MKRLFSAIAAPIMAFFAGANAATPAASASTAEPAAIVQEATEEQAAKELTPESIAPQDGGLSGKVTAIDGTTVTVALAEKPELPADGEKPEGEAPEKPADDRQPADGQTPPEKPADEGEAPEKPADDQQPTDGQTPPEKPADDGNASEKPADGEKPEGEAPEKPADGERPELTFSDETTTYDLSDAVITVEDNGTVSSGDLTDITVDSLLLLKCDEEGNVVAVTVLVNG